MSRNQPPLLQLQGILNQRKLDSVNSVQLSHPLWVTPVVISNNRKQFEIPNTKFEIENRIFVS